MYLVVALELNGNELVASSRYFDVKEPQQVADLLREESVIPQQILVIYDDTVVFHWNEGEHFGKPFLLQDERQPVAETGCAE